MPSQHQPSSKKDAPDPSFNYERAHPEREGGLDRPEVNQATPTDQKDEIQQHDPAGRGKRHISRDDDMREVVPKREPPTG